MCQALSTVYQLLVTVANFHDPLPTIIDEKLSIFTDFIGVERQVKVHKK